MSTEMLNKRYLTRRLHNRDKLAMIAPARHAWRSNMIKDSRQGGKRCSVLGQN